MDPTWLAVAAAIFLLAGLVKGIVGFGLPTVSLALFALTSGLVEAMALLLLPSLVTNLLQAVQGGGAFHLARRLWLFLLLAFLTILAGGALLHRADTDLLGGLLGVLIMIYALITLSGYRARWVGEGRAGVAVLFGAANGILTGLTGSFVVPGVMYLQSMGLSRDGLVQSMGILFTLSTIGLAAALAINGDLRPDLTLVSAVGVVPALIGMMIGRRVRSGISEPAFRRLFLLALLALGGFIVLRAGFTV